MSSSENTTITPEVLSNNQEEQLAPELVTQSPPEPKNVVADATTLNDPQASANASTKVSRKRTKTGCLSETTPLYRLT